MNSTSYKLISDGVAVVPVYDRFAVQLLWKSLQTEIMLQREFTEDAYNTGIEPVIGAFGALGTPSSFHLPTIRQVRQHLTDLVQADLATGDWPGTTTIQALFDRLSIRKPGTRQAHGQWHRDTPPGLIQFPSSDDPIFRHKSAILAPNTAELIYQGWLNLSPDQVQYFRCVPGSHDISSVGQGFSKCPKPDCHTIYSVKPGEMILFDNRILHTIDTTVNSSLSVRLFTPFALNSTGKNFYPDRYLENVLSLQSTCVLPSGQLPPIYSPNHYIRSEKLLSFTSQFSEEFFITGSKYPARFLNFLPVPSFDPYTDEEIRPFIPRPLKQ